jgi:hypothetical protein
MTILILLTFATIGAPMNIATVATACVALLYDAIAVSYILDL